MFWKKKSKGTPVEVYNGKTVRVIDAPDMIGRNAYSGYEGVYRSMENGGAYIDAGSSKLIIPLLDKCKFDIL